MVLVLKLELHLLSSSHALSLRKLTKVNQNQNNKQAEMIDLSKKNEQTLSEIDKRLSLFSDLVKKNEKKLLSIPEKNLPIKLDYILIQMKIY